MTNSTHTKVVDPNGDMALTVRSSKGKEGKQMIVKFRMSLEALISHGGSDGYSHRSFRFNEANGHSQTTLEDDHPIVMQVWRIYMHCKQAGQRRL